MVKLKNPIFAPSSYSKQGGFGPLVPKNYTGTYLFSESVFFPNFFLSLLVFLLKQLAKFSF